MKLLKSRGFQRYARNSSWAILDQLVRMGLGFFVGVLVARYLGPSDFGLFSYVGAVVALISATTRLGLDSILVRELVAKDLAQSTVMASAFWLLCASAFLGLAFGCAFFYLQSDDWSLFLLGSGVIAFQAFSVIDAYFQSEVNSRPVAICRVVGLVLSSILMFLGATAGVVLAFFFAAQFFEKALVATLYYLVGRNASVPRYFGKPSLVVVRALLHQAWPMVLTAVAVTLYMRIDQLMIKSMLGVSQLGLYSAAARVYEAWVAVPYLLSVSLLPALVSAKKANEVEYERKLLLLFRFLFYSSFIVGLISIFGGSFLIRVAFGDEYAAAGDVFGIMMVAASISAVGSANVRYLIVEKMERKIAFRTFFTAGVNVALNLLLIPVFGIEGAAMSTLASLFLGNFVLDMFDRKLVKLSRIRRKAIFFY